MQIEIQLDKTNGRRRLAIPYKHPSPTGSDYIPGQLIRFSFAAASTKATGIEELIIASTDLLQAAISQSVFPH